MGATPATILWGLILLHLPSGFCGFCLAVLSFMMLPLFFFKGFPGGSAGKESACNVGGLGWEDPLEKGAATHSSILAWRILCTVYSMGWQSWTQLNNFHFHFSVDCSRVNIAFQLQLSLNLTTWGIINFFIFCFFIRYV